MIFYGNGVVWNAETNSPLVKFKDGTFSTDNPDLAKILIPLYPHTGELAIDVEFKEVKPATPGQDIVKKARGDRKTPRKAPQKKKVE